MQHGGLGCHTLCHPGDVATLRPVEARVLHSAKESPVSSIWSGGWSGGQLETICRFRSRQPEAGGYAGSTGWGVSALALSHAAGDRSAGQAGGCSSFSPCPRWEGTLGVQQGSHFWGSGLEGRSRGGAARWMASGATLERQPGEGEVSEGGSGRAGPQEDWAELEEAEELEEEARALAASFEAAREAIPDEEEAELENPAKDRGRSRRRNKLQFTSQVPDHLLPKVAIVGRPNVGKSALFNRIAGRELAIVHDEAGVTRDRLYTRAFWARHEFLLADTGGVLTPPAAAGGASDAVAVTSAGGEQALSQAAREAAAAGLPSMVERQAAMAAEEAQTIIFVVDGQAGLTGADQEIAAWLRRRFQGRARITLAVNKCESPTKGALQASEFWALGFSPFPISAISGTGTGDLLDDVCAELARPQAADEEEEEAHRCTSLAIVGRPNVGKSSILNALVGEERTIVSPISGTTRDAIDTDFLGPDGKEYRLIDTAGIRRRGAVAAANSRTEALSVNRAFRAIRRADVVALVIDAMVCVTEQDFRLGERIEQEGKACVVVVNKWDTVPGKGSTSTLDYELDVRERLRCLDWAPIVYASATTGQRIPRVLEEARKAADERAQRLPTAVLNQVVQEAISFRPPAMGKGGKHGRIYYCTQAAVRPPSFVFFVNDATLFPELYRRYMEKQIRKNVGFPGTPIRLLWRSKKKRERVDGGQGKGHAASKKPAGISA